MGIDDARLPIASDKSLINISIVIKLARVAKRIVILLYLSDHKVYSHLLIIAVI